MSYKEFFDKNKREVSKKAIATKIIDMIEKIELNNTTLSARRWVWELIQNARDISHDKIDINIHVDDKTVKFSHNGKPFKSTHLLSLINQVSAKDRNDDNVVGRYGTGFITTALLSKEVEIESLIKEDNEALKKFKINLDRRSNNIEELSKSIENTLLQLDSIDKSEEIKYTKGEMTTTFTYMLNTQQAREVAKSGYNDLLNCIDYVLILQPKINRICLNNVEIYTEKIDDDTFEDIDGSLYKVFKGNDTNIYLKVDDDKSSFIIPIDFINNKYIIKETDTLIPKLFCEFPCVGTENFSFPVVFNNRSFFLTEPRDGVYLTESSKKDVQANRRYVEDGVETLIKIIKFMSNITDKVEGIEKLLYLPEYRSYDWQNDDYIQMNIIRNIRHNVKNTPFILIEDKIYSLDEICIADFENPQERELANVLLNCAYKEEVVPTSDYDKYLPLKNCMFDIFKDINNIIDIPINCTDINQLSNKLINKNNTKKLNAVEFINKIIELCYIDKNNWAYLNDIAIFPTLDGSFKRLNEVYDISDVLESVKQLFIKASINKGIGYTILRHPSPSAYLNPNINSSKLNTRKYSTIEILNKLEDYELTLEGSLEIISIAPPNTSGLYEIYTSLLELAIKIKNIPKVEVNDSYSIEFIRVCEKAILNEILQNPKYGIEITNKMLKYINDNGHQALLKMNLNRVRISNIKGGIAPIHSIPTKECYYMTSNNLELQEIYFEFYPEVEGRTIDPRYKYIEELFQPVQLTDFNMANYITKKVLQILNSGSNRRQIETELLQKIYNYMQLNYEKVDNEFPRLKEKMYLLCSNEILKENQDIINKVREEAIKRNMTVEEYMKETTANKVYNMSNYFDFYEEDTDLDEYLLDWNEDMSDKDINRARKIGKKGEKMAYEEIINYYIVEGYEVVYDKDNETKLSKKELEGEINYINVKLFFDNQQGYDIIISKDDVVMYYIEVKATVSRNIKKVGLSRSQMAKASICHFGYAEYILICITDIECKPIFNVVINPFAQIFCDDVMSMKVAVSMVDVDKSIHRKLAY